MGDDAAFVRRYVACSLGGLLCVALAVGLWRHALAEPPPPEFALGAGVSVVSIRHAASGKYLAISREDGLLRATAISSAPSEARFRVHVLSSATVEALKLASASSPAAAATTTRSGCACSGFSNEHGFGRYCLPWESEMQAPWCYVDDRCRGELGGLGSFGRRHDECPQPWEAGMPPAANESEWSFTGAPAADVHSTWVAPAECPCSGVRSALGYGASCKDWEYDGQQPWCYVHDNCSLASAAGRAGSFGHRYLDCVLSDTDGEGRVPEAAVSGRERQAGRQEEAGQAQQGGGEGGRRLQGAAEERAASTESPWAFDAARRLGELLTTGGTTRGRDADESALLESVERLRQPYVALVSLATEGFVSVELPPHRYALAPHARHDALSLRGVLSFQRGGGVLSLGTNALLNLCDDDAAARRSEAEPTGRVCTGFYEAGSAHPKLLRSMVPSSVFKVERIDIERQPAPKPLLASAPRGRGQGKGGGMRRGSATRAPVSR